MQIAARCYLSYQYIKFNPEKIRTDEIGKTLDYIFLILCILISPRNHTMGR